MTNEERAERDALALRKGYGEELSHQDEWRLELLNRMAQADQWRANAKPWAGTPEELAEFRSLVGEQMAKEQEAEERGEPRLTYSTDEVRQSACERFALAREARRAYRDIDPGSTDDDGWDLLDENQHLGWQRVVDFFEHYARAKAGHERVTAERLFAAAEERERELDAEALKARHVTERMRERLAAALREQEKST